MAKNNKIRFVYTGYASGAYNMALDEALLESVKSGAPQIIRFYKFEPPTITIGRFQKISDVLNFKLPIVRRITGGRAVIHDGDLTYSLVCKENEIFGSFYDCYKNIGIIFSEALKKFGINCEMVKVKCDYKSSVLCFDTTARYELRFGKKKLLGSAQKKDNNIILQQGSLFIPVDHLEFILCVKKVIESIGIEILSESISEEEKLLTNKFLEKYINKEWNYNGS